METTNTTPVQTNKVVIHSALGHKFTSHTEASVIEISETLHNIDSNIDMVDYPKMPVKTREQLHIEQLQAKLKKQENLVKEVEILLGCAAILYITWMIISFF